MKEIKTLREGSNFTAVTVGKLDKVSEYSLPLGESVVINGKVFTGGALKSTGMEMSLQTFAPGEGSSFVHAHKEHEELYMVISGEGEFRVDDALFEVGEGSLVRVAPAGKRALRNTGNGPMLVMCIQYKANSFGSEDTPAADGIILEDEVFPDGLK